MHEMDNAQTRKKARPEATEGDWWRFSMYEIRDGCICPSEGAKLEWYDPWPDFQNTRGQTIGQAPDGSQPGYQSLMKLVAQLEYLPGPGQTRYPDCLTQKSQTLIVEWCRQNGLLGVLLSRWEAIRVAPQEGRTDRWSQKRYSCGFGQVVQVQTMTGDVNHRPATVLIHELNDLTLVEESPGKTWSRFFPVSSFRNGTRLHIHNPTQWNSVAFTASPCLISAMQPHCWLGQCPTLGSNNPRSKATRNSRGSRPTIRSTCFGDLSPPPRSWRKMDR